MRRVTAKHHSACLLLLWVLALCHVPSSAWAENDTAEEEVLPSGTARLRYGGQVFASARFLMAPEGPLFDLPAIASLLSVELRTGPYGDSNSLEFENGQYIVGPDEAAMVRVPRAGGEQTVSALSRRPLKRFDGLKVPLDFLQRTFGEELGLQFQWIPGLLELQIETQDVRQLDIALNLVHQFGLSTLEIELSQVPRYRVEVLPGAVEIRFSGDRLLAPSRSPTKPDPLIDEIVVSPDRIRIQLKEGAAAAEPRLLESPAIRLIVEIFPRVETGDEAESAARTTPQPRGGLRTIVLDPGHGGEESGAVGPSGTAEKDLALQVGRSLKAALERRLAVRVVMTRETDVDVAFETRTSIANQNKADLFISLHFNASFGPRAHGAETYFLSREASDQLAAAAAEAENEAAGEASPELDLQMILWDLAQSYHLAESQRFARLVQEELNQTLGLRDRGVKQAPFRVLMGANMPAVLVELGFLSNPDEESKLQRPQYRSELVDSLVRAIVRFKRQIESQPEPPEEDL